MSAVSFAIAACTLLVRVPRRGVPGFHFDEGTQAAGAPWIDATVTCLVIGSGSGPDRLVFLPEADLEQLRDRLDARIDEIRRNR